MVKIIFLLVWDSFNKSVPSGKQNQDANVIPHLLPAYSVTFHNVHLSARDINE